VVSTSSSGAINYQGLAELGPEFENCLFVTPVTDGCRSVCSENIVVVFDYRRHSKTGNRNLQIAREWLGGLVEKSA